MCSKYAQALNAAHLLGKKMFVNKCDRFTGMDIKPAYVILRLLNILIVEIIKRVVPKCDHSRTKIGFLTNFQSPSGAQTRF